MCPRLVNLTAGKYIAPFLFSLLSLNALSQSSDCNSAVSVCNAVYDENDSPAGTGNVFEVAPGSCQTGGEFNSAWYVFSPQDDGVLNFILQPNNNNDDYDWSLFDITDNGCEGINSGLSPEVSCNSYGVTGGFQGPTGISSAEGGAGSNNGPGDLNGPPFNGDLTVTEGSVYALVVMNYSSTLNGYTLDFSSSEVSIFDEIAPSLVSTDFVWCSGELVLEFDEDIEVNGLSNGDFGFDQPAYSVTSFDAGNTDLSSVLNFVISPAEITENITLQMSMQNGEVLSDICGNEVTMPIVLDLTGGFTFESTTTLGCNGEGASLDLQLENDNFPPYSVTINGDPAPTFPALDLPTGLLEIIVTDALGCEDQATELIQNQVATIELPEDTVLCSLSDNFIADMAATSIAWEPVEGLQFSNPSAASTSVSSEVPGTYTLVATVTTGNCTQSDFMNVTFNYPPALDYTTTPAQCYGSCNGELTVTNSNPASITVLLSTDQATGQEVSFTGLCAGNYNMEVIHSPECRVTYPFTIEEPEQIAVSFDASEWIVSYDDPQVILTSSFSGADSVFWSVTSMEDLTSTDSIWDLMLPHEPGYYEIQIIAGDSSGCMNSFKAFVEVRDLFNFYVPNAFSPNEDGINDYFQVAFTYPPVNYDLQIYDRYGSLVFHSTDPGQIWMGNTGDGQYYCPNGVYTWQMRTRGVELDEKTYKGHITLFR